MPILIFAILLIVGSIGFLIWANKSENASDDDRPAVVPTESPQAPQADFNEPVAAENSHNPPGLNKRVCGYLIDSLIVTIIGMGFFAALKINTMITTAILILFRDSFNGQSPGKMLIGLKVQSDSGQDMSLTEGIIRNISMAIPFVMIIEYFVMRVDPQRKRLGDRYAKTTVIDLKPQVQDKVFLFYSFFALFLHYVLMMLLAEPVPTP